MSNSRPEAVEGVSLSPSLVVEDDPAMRERLGHVLATLGHGAPQIAWADSIAAAKELLDAQSFGIALVDIGLPDGSGVELIGWMQAQHPKVPAVVISAFRTEDVIFAALRAGAIGYLLKDRDDLELGIALRSIEQGARRSIRPLRAISSAGLRRSCLRRPPCRRPMHPLRCPSR